MHYADVDLEPLLRGWRTDAKRSSRYQRECRRLGHSYKPREVNGMREQRCTRCFAKKDTARRGLR